MQVDDRPTQKAGRADLVSGGMIGTHRRSRSKQTWRRRFVALALVVAVVAGLGAGAAYEYTSMRRGATQLETDLLGHLERGQSELEAAKNSLKQANSTHNPKLIQEAKVHFISAKLQFMTARQIADTSSLLSQAEGLPYVGPQARSRHQSVDAVAEMGIQLSLAGLDLADVDGEIISPAGSGQQGKTLLTMLSQVQDKLGPVQSELQAAFKASAQVDLSILPPAQRATFEHGRGSISQALAAIQQFKGLVPILTEVLGGNGARTYLVEQLNPAELRPGGGFIGTYSVLRADHGVVTLVRSGGAEEFIFPRATVGQRGYVAPPAPFEQLVPGLGWSFIDSNFFADFPSNAAAGENFVGSRLGMHFDGVIAIDYYTVASFLAVTGPIGVPGYRLTLTADNFVPTVVQYDIQALTDNRAAAIHKAVLSAVAGPLLQRVVTGSSSQWPALIATLNGLAASRHLQVYFNNADVEKTMTQYGWSGVDKAAPGTDYMMEVEANLGGTKANYFVTRTYSVELSRSGNVLHHRVVVDIKDDMPFNYRPGEYYKAYIRMFVSDNATALWSDLSYPYYPKLGVPPGTQMLDGWILIHGYGHDRAVTFQWDTPWKPNGRGVEQVYWQKQPGTQADKIDVTWHDGNGHTYKVSGDLGQDRVITLAPNGVSLVPGQVGTAQLPSLSLG